MRFNIENEFLTVDEVSQVLKLSVITIYKYIRQRRLEAIEFGGHYRIERSSLEKFINEHKVNKNALSPKTIDNLEAKIEKVSNEMKKEET